MAHKQLAVCLTRPDVAGVWADGVPNWLTAVATCGALAAAVFAGVTAKRLYDTEHARDLRAAAAERARQANEVVAWASWTDIPSAALRLPNGDTSRVNLAVRNASGVPVYDAVVEYSCDGKALGGQKFSVLSPTGDEPHHREIKASGVGVLVAKPRGPSARLDIRVSMEFTDALGLRWRRETSGILRQIENKSAPSLH